MRKIAKLSKNHNSLHTHHLRLLRTMPIFSCKHARKHIDSLVSRGLWLNIVLMSSSDAFVDFLHSSKTSFRSACSKKKTCTIIIFSALEMVLPNMHNRFGYITIVVVINQSIIICAQQNQLKSLFHSTSIVHLMSSKTFPNLLKNVNHLLIFYILPLLMRIAHKRPK